MGLMHVGDVARWQNEVKILQALLPKYHAHVLAHPNTLLVKFYGLHRVKPLHGNNVSRLLPLPLHILCSIAHGKSLEFIAPQAVWALVFQYPDT